MAKDPEFWLLALRLAEQGQGREVDPELGWPPLFGKLCCFADAYGRRSYLSSQDPGSSKVETIIVSIYNNGVFPFVAKSKQISRTVPTEFQELTWRKLRPVGPGLDPARFRLSEYGEVLDREADPDSSLYPHLDHIFPVSRGGLTCENNLRFISWIANQRKAGRLECFIPYHELACGVNRNLFLHALETQRDLFRSRCLAFFFSNGVHEAAAVNYSRNKFVSSQPEGYSRPYSRTRAYTRFTPQETQDLLEGYLQHAHGSDQTHLWRKIQREYPSLWRRTGVDLKDKIRNLVRKGNLAQQAADLQEITSNLTSRKLSCIDTHLDGSGRQQYEASSRPLKEQSSAAQAADQVSLSSVATLAKQLPVRVCSRYDGFSIGAAFNGHQGSTEGSIVAEVDDNTRVSSPAGPGSHHAEQPVNGRDAWRIVKQLLAVESEILCSQ